MKIKIEIIDRVNDHYPKVLVILEVAEPPVAVWKGLHRYLPDYKIDHDSNVLDVEATWVYAKEDT